MPCNSDYLEPTHYEKEAAKAAELLCFTKQLLGLTPGEHEIKYSNAARYPRHEDGDRITASLCNLLSSLNTKEFAEAFKDLGNVKVLQLRTRRAEHQEADRKRIAKEKLEQEQERTKTELITKALKKLSQEEKRALGLK